jgi:hypothetical protein
MGWASSSLSASGGEAELILDATNLGDAAAGGSIDPVVLVDTLPPGAAALDATAIAGTPLGDPPAVECAVEASRTVSCLLKGELVPYDRIDIRIRVDLTDGSSTGGLNRFEVSGGGAPPAVLEREAASHIADSLGIEEFELRAEEEGGTVGLQAGSHPFQVTATVSLTQTSEALPTRLPKDLRMRLPLGLLADVGAVPACPSARYFEAACSLASVVGVGIFAVNTPDPLGRADLVAPIYNLQPLPEQPARFGSLPLGLPVTINSSIRGDDYAGELSIDNIPGDIGFLGATVVLWGAPADPRHDDARDVGCLYAARGASDYSCKRLEAAEPAAMLTMPTSCASPRSSVAEVAPWTDRYHPAAATSPFPPMTGCDRLPFRPVAATAATTSSTSSPSGLGLSLGTEGQGWRDPDALAESVAERIAVTLPQGFTINPSAANGLSSCGHDEYDAVALNAGGCPDASKLGSLTIESPVFSQPLSGNVYLGAQENRRFDGSIPLDLIARNHRLGILVKLRAGLRLDPLSGRIRVVAEGLPQLPLSSLRLDFPQGSRALLATPPRCGAFPVEAEFTPYSDPASNVVSRSALTTSSGQAEASCPGPTLPFHPALSGGTLDNVAGRYSPLYLRLSRDDGEAELSGLSLSFPPGLAARIARLPTCSSEELVAAAAKPAAEEAAAPSCPAGSQVGRVLIGAGVGPVLSYVPGNLYLAGSYQGAPFSLAAVIPVGLGPLDLGTIVRRFPIEVAPLSGQLGLAFGDAQRLPSIRDGIALHLHDLRLYLDRADFTVNPTDCEPMAIKGFAYGSEGQVAPVAERFQAAGCRRLRFKPSLSLRLFGGAGRNAHPGLRATIRGGDHEARLASASFTLPTGQLLDFHHVQALCGHEQPVASCPPSSRIGRVRLRSPLLGRPLHAPLFLRVPARGLPALVADLRAGDVGLVLHGQTAAAPAGRLRVSLPRLPDLPLTEATLVLDGGRRGLLVNTEAACGARGKADATLEAHSGKVRRLHPRLRCSF